MLGSHLGDGSPRGQGSPSTLRTKSESPGVSSSGQSRGRQLPAPAPPAVDLLLDLQVRESWEVLGASVYVVGKESLKGMYRAMLVGG